MQLTKFDPFRPVPTINSLMDEIFNGSIDRTAGLDNLITRPSVNIKETDTSYLVELAAPGMKREEFDIKVENDYLTITGSREQKEEEKKEKYTRREFRYTSFKRSFLLPETVNGDDITAHLEDGVLTVELMKKEEAKVKPVRTIEIK